MKKFLFVFSLFFSLNFLLIPLITYASQTSVVTYYPSSNGAYNKVQLMNQVGGPNENSSTSAFCLQTATGYDSVPTSGHTYINAGTIFADPTSGYLEICKADGSVASYPGASFNRFCTGANCATAAGSCPPNYTAVSTSGGTPFSGVTAYSCVFTNSGTSSTAKSGCFSNFSVANRPTAPSAPTSCSTVDPNAYDMGCQLITTAGTYTYKRDCCFNSGANALGTSSTCPPAPMNCANACQNQCGAVEACGETLTCGSCPCGSFCQGGGCSSYYCNATQNTISNNGSFVTLPNPVITGGTENGTCMTSGYYGTVNYTCTASCSGPSSWVLTTGSPSCIENQCQGTDPANSSLCGGTAAYPANSIPPTNNTTSYTTVTTCPSSSNCEVLCSGGYTGNGSSCAPNTCLTQPLNSTNCNSTLPTLNNTPFTIVASCGSTPCTAVCKAGYTNNGLYCDNCSSSGSYTTAATPSYPGNVWETVSNTQNGEFCVASGSLITGINPSDPCQGTNTAGESCTPTFYLQVPLTCPASVPETLACADTGEPGCSGYLPCNVTCGQYHNQCC